MKESAPPSPDLNLISLPDETPIGWLSIVM
jgi:hypothetical protein